VCMYHSDLVVQVQGVHTCSRIVQAVKLWSGSSIPSYGGAAHIRVLAMCRNEAACSQQCMQSQYFTPGTCPHTNVYKKHQANTLQAYKRQVLQFA
jgi:hypothetical protein